MNKFDVRVAQLADYCQEYGCGKKEALVEILMDFYEAAGFCAELLEIEINSMSDEELMEAYLIM